MKARLACSLPVPNPDETRAIVLAWAEVLESIPTRCLDAAYLSAMRQHVVGPSSRGPFSVAEMVAAWDMLVKNGRAKAIIDKSRMIEGDQCVWCNGGGLKYLKKVDEDRFEPVLWNSQGIGDADWAVTRCHCRLPAL